MKIVFINRFFYPDHSATSQLLTDLCFHLAKSGIDVSVITGRQVYDDPGITLPGQVTVQGVHIIRVWTSRFGRQALWGRAIDYGTFYLSALWCLLRIVRAGDVVVAKTDPPLISVIAAAAAKLRGAILINWIQDLFPEVASALAVQGSDWLEQPLRILRNRSLRAARRNIAIGEGMARRIGDEGITRDTISVIHNWADGLAIQPVDREKNDLRREWDLQDKFVVGYSGNLGRAHEFATILNAAERTTALKEIMFLFIGGGAQQSWLRDEVERKGLRNVMFKPYQPREHLSVSLGVSDLHLISLQPSLEGLIVPSKFYGIIAAGRPVLYIGDQNGEIPNILSKAQCGFCLGVNEDEKVASLIRHLAHDQDQCRELGLRARAIFDLRFNNRVALEAWESIFQTAA